MQSKHPILLTTLLSLALLLAIFTPALAQSTTPGLDMSAEAAYEGNFKYGEWVPVWVTLENSGADLSGEVIVRVTGSGGTMAYASPVELPGGARKRLPIYSCSALGAGWHSEACTVQGRDRMYGSGSKLCRFRQRGYNGVLGASRAKLCPGRLSCANTA